MRNLKKVVALVAVFAMMVSMVAFADVYTDVKAGDDYAEAIEILSSLDILTGDKDDSGNAVFRPNDSITRAEVATIVERIQNVKSAAQTNTVFTDVPSSHWASGFIALAEGHGIINGYGDGTFGPEDNVKYEDVVKMVVETLGYKPFVDVNGGYYAGHLLAAQRYGIVEGVKGATIGELATRGQVAQIIYNAIDTPIMERSVYGTEEEFTIYDGENYREYITLLTRDLNVAKGTGVVEKNAVATLTAVETIDTTKDEVVSFDFDTNSKEYGWYDLDEVDAGTVFANGTDIGSYLGKEVTVYLQETNKRGQYNVISAAETSRNKELVIPIENFSDFAVENSKNFVKYFKDENARTTTDVRINDTYSVIYNGVGVTASETNIENLFTDKTWSGQMTLIDNGKGTNYNVISIEVAAAAVVDEVSANGKVLFKNLPKSKDGKNIVLDFDEDLDDTIIKLTKDGAAIDYTELTEWDVISVLTNYNNEYYVADVVAAGKIEGTITETAKSTTSADGTKYKINGEFYDLANGYEANGKLAPGASGTFYVDNYKKIVAYDKTGATAASDKYAYVLEAKETIDDWGKPNVRVQFLDKTGAIGDVYLASTVKFENAGMATDDSGDVLSTTLGIDAESGQIKLENLTTAKAESIAEALKNQLITYAVNDSTELRTITFAQNDEDDGSLWIAKDAEDAEFDADNSTIKVSKKWDVDESTIIFFINNATGNVYDNAGSALSGTATKNASKIGTVASLSEGETYDYAQVYDAQDGIASVLVLFNTTGGISSSSSVAVIDSIGYATVDGDEVTSVTYFYNGEKLTGYLSTNYQGDVVNGTTAAQGNLWKFAVNGTTIEEGRLITSYADTSNDWDNVGAPTFQVAALKAKEDVVYGPVIDYVSSSRTLRIAPWATATSAYDFVNYDGIKTTDANVYVLDPAKRTNKVYVGYVTDATYDKQLVEQATSTTLVVKDAETTPNVKVDETKQALGMMDFAVGVSYDDDVTDVVIYKAPDFGRYSVVTK